MPAPARAPPPKTRRPPASSGRAASASSSPPTARDDDRDDRQRGAEAGQAAGRLRLRGQRAQAAGGGTRMVDIVVPVDIVEALGLDWRAPLQHRGQTGVAALIDRDDRDAVGDVVLQDLDAE